MRHVRVRRRTAQGGYAYLALLILIAIISVAAAGSAEFGAIYQRRAQEKELLAVGGEFQRALLSYANATPLGQPTQPRTFDDLLRDPRYPTVVRHLRKLYVDPMTGKADWVLVQSPDGQTIVGIHSASLAHPIQIAKFPAEFQGFEHKKSYAEWVFVVRVPALMQGQIPPGQTPPDSPSPNGVSPGSAVPNGASPNGGFPGSSSPNGASPNGGFPGSAFPGSASPNGASPNSAFPNSAPSTMTQ
ncbi:MAG TPA: type II secretion system protein [Paraburkholderia sp.]